MRFVGVYVKRGIVMQKIKEMTDKNLIEIIYERMTPGLDRNLDEVKAILELRQRIKERRFEKMMDAENFYLNMDNEELAQKNEAYEIEIKILSGMCSAYRDVIKLLKDDKPSVKRIE